MRGIAWESGIVGGVVGPDGILQSCVILLLVVVSLCSVSGLHCDFARPCDPILAPFILPQIVLPGFVRMCMDCMIDTGLPRYCRIVRARIVGRATASGSGRLGHIYESVMVGRWVVVHLLLGHLLPLILGHLLAITGRGP